MKKIIIIINCDGDVTSPMIKYLCNCDGMQKKNKINYKVK